MDVLLDLTKSAWTRVIVSLLKGYRVKLLAKA